MRVLPDAMVLVAGLTSRREPASFSRRLVEAAVNGDVGLVLTETLLDETRAVLLDRAFPGRLTVDLVDALLDGLRVLASEVIADRGASHPPRCADPDDDYLVDAALRTGAMLVSRDEAARFTDVPGLDCGRPGSALQRAGLLG